MKSCIMAAYLATTAVGNLIIIIIEATTGTHGTVSLTFQLRVVENYGKNSEQLFYICVKSAAYDNPSKLVKSEKIPSLFC